LAKTSPFQSAHKGRPSAADPSTLVLSTEASGSQAEAIRTLRTHILAQHIQQGRRALAVCAVSRGVGCSFVAANLALGLAQTGVRTILIDADLRNPEQQDIFQLGAAGPGLAECLQSESGSFSESVRANVQPNLSVMFAGKPPPNPQELLAGNRFKALMQFCLREFDATIVDTPPANSFADARRVSTVVGYSLIVARRNLTYVDDIKVLVEQLQADRARVIGTVLNGG